MSTYRQSFEDSSIVKKKFGIVLFLASLGIIGFLTVVNKGNMTLSETCRYWVVDLYRKLGFNPDGRWWNSMPHFRKIGHVIEYFLLGISSRIMVEKACSSLVVCAVVSVLDQLLKIVIPLRHFDSTDLIFDAIGYMVGVGLVTLIVWATRKSTSR